MKLQVNNSEVVGKMKPMHAVNNGPVYKFTYDQRITNMELFQEAGIPYARNHDASFCSTYGGEHTVDISAIFPDFDKDENNPASYDFHLTDEYMRVIAQSGAKVFYRLGQKIEHTFKKFHVHPPKDFAKWARICEHIIRHYNQGWAEGMRLGIEYWEIWNEPNLNKGTTWTGTAEQYFDLYNITANHLKKCFPEIKVGGPTTAGLSEEWLEPFFKALNAPLDFFSFHAYESDPHEMQKYFVSAKNMLLKYGYPDTEVVLDEWNYVCGWSGADWLKSLKTEKSLKGAAFTASVFMLGQYSPVDLLMYYDCRPCAMNGMFDTDSKQPLKGYYPFRMFNQLYRKGNALALTTEGNDLFACAAKNDRGTDLMFNYYNDDDTKQPGLVEIQVDNLPASRGMKADYYYLDETRNEELVKTEIFYGETYRSAVKLPLYTTCLVKIYPL